MKTTIKTILREEAGGGTYSDPFYDESSDLVPAQSYDARKYNYQTKTYETVSVVKSIFLKATKLLVQRFNKGWFSDMADMDDNLWARHQEMIPTLKILGLSEEGIANKAFWAAHDNFDGLKDGSITKYDQLQLRAFSSYSVPLNESVTVYQDINWAPDVYAYTQNDAESIVLYDEDGVYDSYEWDGHQSHQVDEHDWEGQGKELSGAASKLRVIYPASGGDETPAVEDIDKSPESDEESKPITEAVGPSPEENDIIDELEILVTSLGDTDCSSQLRELINKYRNLPLNERYNKKNIRRN